MNRANARPAQSDEVGAARCGLPHGQDGGRREGRNVASPCSANHFTWKRWSRSALEKAVQLGTLVLKMCYALICMFLALRAMRVRMRVLVRLIVCVCAHVLVYLRLCFARAFVVLELCDKVR